MSAQSSGSATLLMFVFLGVIALVGVFGVPQFAPVAASPSDRTSDRLSGRFGPIEESPLDESSADAAADRTHRPRFGQCPSVFVPLAKEEDRDTPFDGEETAFSSIDREHLQRPVMAGDRPSEKRDELSEWPGGALDGWDLQTDVEGESIDGAHSEGQRSTGFSLLNSDRPIQLERESSVPFPASAESENSLSGDDELAMLGSQPDGQSAPASLEQLEEEGQPRPIAFGRREIVRSGGADDAAARAEGRREPLTWRAAVARLNALGIRDYRLSPGERPHQFHFSCFFTPADIPRITHRFEAEANQPLEAVEKVLDQVDVWLADR